MKRTKHSLLFSGLSLAVSAALLAGTTLAWFTDSVTNTGNAIEAGTLDIALDIGEQEKLFGSDDTFLWEPGRSQKAAATVSNEGSLWLKYSFSFANVKVAPGTADPDADITEVLDVYKVPAADAAAEDLKADNYLGTVKSMMEGSASVTENGILAPKGYAGADGSPSETFTLVVRMQESAGNAYQDCGVTFDVVIKAAQTPHETDGFGNPDYDLNAEYAWSGGKDDTGLAENTDDQAKTISIDTPEQLASFAAAVNTGTNYKDYTVTLTGDIDLAGKEWTPIGKKGSSFQGVFDGAGHTVSNLKISTPGKNDVGFFGFTQSGEVKNLTIHNAQVEGYLDVGAVAGTPYTSKYTDIRLTGTVQVKGFSYVGGMFGKNAYADLTNLTVDVTEDSSVYADSRENGTDYRTYVGGVVGFMGEGHITVSNVTSNIDVYGSTCDVGGVTGIAHYNNTFENCSSSGDVSIFASDLLSDAKEIGGIAGVWHNQDGTTVTLRGCSFTGTLHAELFDGTDVTSEVSANTLTGPAYSATGTGQLIIE